MNQNLLVERLKFIKRELSALKTAHKRGLGLLKIYDYTYVHSGDGFYDVVVDIKFSQEFGPFPFFSVVGYFDSELVSVRIEQARYTDNGYRAICEGYAIFSEERAVNGFVVYSTAPITELNVNTE